MNPQNVEQNVGQTSDRTSDKSANTFAIGSAIAIRPKQLLNERRTKAKRLALHSCEHL